MAVQIAKTIDYQALLEAKLFTPSRNELGFCNLGSGMGVAYGLFRRNMLLSFYH